jgi:acetylornithine deacetylase/succinyl-diaminopimelate desuccinylase-like protein
MSDRAAALAAFESRFEESVQQLCALARIPSVSFPGFDAREVERSAEAVARLLREVGLSGVEVLRMPGVHPYVVGEWLGAGEGAPTVLLYAHHDVQPPGRTDRWRSPPFEPTRCDDGRLYGRGVVDDKAGIVLHAAAIRAWLEGVGRVPVNVKVVVEGEEETGSLHLAEFLRLHHHRLQAHVLVLSDTTNLQTGLPSLTVSLRGMVAVDVTVRALDHPLHSGVWGGAVPDAATALTRLLARLVDAEGAIAIPGLYDDVPELAAAERARLASLPLDQARLRREAGLPPGVAWSGEADRTLYERLWTRPSLAILALESMPLGEAGNQLLAEARARVGIRLAPGQDAARARDLLVDFLRAEPPWGVPIETEVRVAVPGWRTEPIGPAFEAARRALAAGYGREAVAIGCGASIPFVGPFAEVLGAIPSLLLGVEDPPCNAHGENESLDLADFRRAAHATMHLLAELAEVPTG